MLGDTALAADPNFATNVERVKRRAETDGKVAAAFGALDVDALDAKARRRRHRLRAASTTPAELARHPHLRRITVGTPSGPVSYPAPAAQKSATQHYGPVPALGEHTAKVRAEFSLPPCGGG